MRSFDAVNAASGCRAGQVLATAALMLFASGCWEEIHYTPKPAAPKATATVDAASVDAAPSEAPAGGAASPEPNLPESTPTSPPKELLAAPSTGDLFPDAVEVDNPDADAAESILPTPAEPTLPPTVTDVASDDDEDGTSLSSPPAAEQRLAWQAASKWSLAAALSAKGVDASRYEPMLAEANAAANEIGIELPPLPTASERTELEAAVIEGLRGEAAVALTNALADRFGPAEAAAGELAIRTHMLLLTYTPRASDTAMQAEALRRVAEASGLPATAWEPLVKLLEERAAYADVKQAAFDLHRQVDAHLSGAAEPRN